MTFPNSLMKRVVLQERRLALMLNANASLRSQVILRSQILRPQVLGAQMLISKVLRSQVLSPQMLCSNTLRTNHMCPQMRCSRLNRVVMLNVHAGILVNDPAIVLDHPVGMRYSVLNAKICAVA